MIAHHKSGNFSIITHGTEFARVLGGLLNTESKSMTATIKNVKNLTVEEFISSIKADIDDCKVVWDDVKEKRIADITSDLQIIYA